MIFNKNVFLAVLLVAHSNLGTCKRIKKRQIYRENLQPHTGGKIPDAAFETDRLILNRLQKEGIAILDGIFLEQRNPKVSPYSNSDLRPVFKVTALSDNNLIDMEMTRETTYPIPRIAENRLPEAAIQTSVYEPVIQPLILSNSYLQNQMPPNNNLNSILQYHPYIQQLLPNFHPVIQNTNHKQAPQSIVHEYHYDRYEPDVFVGFLKLLKLLIYDIPMNLLL